MKESDLRRGSGLRRRPSRGRRRTLRATFPTPEAPRARPAEAPEPGPGPQRAGEPSDGAPEGERRFRLLRAGLPWLLLSAAIHLALLAFGVCGPTPPEPVRDVRAPIPVALLPEPPSAEPPQDLLEFRVATHPRMREVRVASRLRALAPPPPDATLTPEAPAGGYAISTHAGGLPGFDLGGIGGDLALGGVGEGNAEGNVGSFQEYLGGVRQAGLDVVFVIDATGSMGWLIADVKERVRSLAGWLRDLVPVTRFGVVAYRDDDDPEFLVRVQPLTLRIDAVYDFLDALEARGGGDVPEGVFEGLAAAIERSGFRADSRRVILVLGDAPPHPERAVEGLARARAFAGAGGTISVVDVSFDANPHVVAAQLGKRVEDLTLVKGRGVMPELREIALAGGGDAVTLEGGTVARQLAVLIFGKGWERALRPMLGDL